MPSAASASTSKAINRLTPLEVKNTKPDEGKTEKNLNDGGRLYLVATATRKRWQFQYGLNGKMHKQWLGDYPKISLAQARKLRDEAAKAVDEGKDPRIERQAAKVAAKYAAANTFEMVAREWHSKEQAGGRWSDDHAARVLQRLTVDTFPVLGSRPIESLKTRDLLHPLQLVAKRDALDLAKRLRQYITAIMRYAVQTGRIETNPAHDLQGAIATRKATHHAALPLTRLAELVTKIDSYTGLKVAKLATRFALLTGARSSEFRFARWTEFDLSAGTWTIPEQREEVEGVKHSGRGEKMSRERVIYLSRQTVALLQELHAINGRAVFVFEGQKRGAPISENTVNLVLRKLGYNTQQDICLHGFRTMMVSSLNESLQFTHDAIERHIGHEGKAREGEAVAGIYKRKAQYLTERQRMLQWWADYLDANAGGQYIAPDAYVAADQRNVIPLPVKAA